MRKSVLALLGASLLCVAPVASAQASGDVSVLACGYYETATDAYYNHCSSNTDPHAGAKIEVDLDWTIFNQYKCVRKGETWLGTTGDIDNAWWVDTCYVS